MPKHYNVGDTVYILAHRSQGGCITVRPTSPWATTYRVETCVIGHIVWVPGAEGRPVDCYGLRWKDTDEPVGLPFFKGAFCSSEGKPLEDEG